MYSFQYILALCIIAQAYAQLRGRDGNSDGVPKITPIFSAKGGKPTNTMYKPTGTHHGDDETGTCSYTFSVPNMKQTCENSEKVEHMEKKMKEMHNCIEKVSFLIEL